jgi:hypothetical protein
MLPLPKGEREFCSSIASPVRGDAIPKPQIRDFFVALLLTMTGAAFVRL